MPQPPPDPAQQPRWFLRPSRYGLTLANGVTAIRLVLVPFIVAALANAQFVQAFWMTMIAGATDAVDGYIARTFGHKSLVGAYLDPVADKVLILSLLGVLTIEGQLPVWFLVLALARDVAIVVTVAVFTRMKQADLRMQPLFVSKLTTVAQIALVLAVLADLAFRLEWADVRTGLLWGAVVMTLASWVAYFFEGLRALRTAEVRGG
jgi:cardiolipin synthase